MTFLNSSIESPFQRLITSEWPILKCAIMSGWAGDLWAGWRATMDWLGRPDRGWDTGLRMEIWAQPRPGPPGSEARLSPQPVARVRRAPMWAWATPWHQLLHPAHGNTDTYRPLIGQIQLSPASDWLVRTSPGPLVPLCVTWVSPESLSRWHMCHGHQRLAVTFCDSHVTLRSVTSHPAASVTTALTPDGDHYKLSRLRGSVIISRGHQASQGTQGSTSNTLFQQTRHTIHQVQYQSPSD